VRALGREFFHYDEGSQTLMGSDTGLTLGIGQKVMVRLTEAAPVTGGLILDLCRSKGRRCNRRGGRAGSTSPASPRSRRQSGGWCASGNDGPGVSHPQTPVGYL
jgi:ribonuclease R